MPITRDEFVNNLVAAHDELIDVADKLDTLLGEIPELGIEPVVVSATAAQGQGIINSIDDAIDATAALKLYVEGFDAVVPEAGLPDVPAGHVSEQFAPGTEDVAAPVPAEDNLISKPAVPVQVEGELPQGNPPEEDQAA